MISKSEVISLKQQAKRLKDYDEKFKPLFNKITNIVNGMKGTLDSYGEEKLRNIYKEYFSIN